jgi:hypothetical protein
MLGGGVGFWSGAAAPAQTTAWDTTSLLIQEQFDTGNIAKDASNNISTGYLDSPTNTKFASWPTGNQPLYQTVNSRGLANFDGPAAPDGSVNDAVWFGSTSGWSTAYWADRTLYAVWFAPATISTTTDQGVLSYKFSAGNNYMLTFNIDDATTGCRPYIKTGDVSANIKTTKSTGTAIVAGSFNLVMWQITAAGGSAFGLNGTMLTSDGVGVQNSNADVANGTFHIGKGDDGTGTAVYLKGRLCEWLLYGNLRSSSQFASDWLIAKARWGQ